jgi:hypothetical protein
MAQPSKPSNQEAAPASRRYRGYAKRYVLQEKGPSVLISCHLKLHAHAESTSTDLKLAWILELTFLRHMANTPFVHLLPR